MTTESTSVKDVILREWSTKKVDLIIRELKARSGFDSWWDSVDDDIQEEIRQSLISILSLPKE